MTSERVDCSRRPNMLKVAAEAPAILASQTDRLENSFWPSKTVFFQDYPAFSNDGRSWKGDDQNIDLMALVVVDDFPAEVCVQDEPEFEFYPKDHKLINDRPSVRSFA